MTREDAHKQVDEWINDKIEPEKNKQYANGKNYTCGTSHYGRMELHRDIDKIYDDFENELQNAYKQGIKDEARCHQPKDNQ